MTHEEITARIKELKASTTDPSRLDDELTELEELLLEPELRPKARQVILFNQGVYLQKLARFDDAVKRYEESIAAGYEDEGVYRNLGLCYSRLNRHAQAAKAYSEGLSKNPEAVNLINGHLLETFRSGEIVKATRLGDVILAKIDQLSNPSKSQDADQRSLANLLDSLSFILSVQNRLADAQEYYRKATSLDSTISQRSLLGTAFREGG